VDLLVHETMRRLPDVDARAPAQRHATHEEAISSKLNCCPALYLKRRRFDGCPYWLLLEMGCPFT
jgi:hypothetical protein